MSTQIEVRAERPYQVHIGAGVLAELPALVAGAARVAIIHPPTLAEVAGPLAADLPGGIAIEVPDAEAAKTPEVLVGLWNRLLELGFTRSDVVVGLGGGATTDLAGFVAATVLRGVRYVSVPTSVLGMVDAAVGGKTGINLPAGKNLVGSFYEPVGVLCDLDLLQSLPADQVRAGMAEVIKCGFIADPAIGDLVDADPRAATTVGTAALAELIARGIRVKAEVVTADLRESTSSGTRVGRELLNYGHTFGHAIERAEEFRWSHGAAISVGMVFVAEVAEQLGWCSQEFVAEQRNRLASVGLPVRYDGAPWADLRATMATDKKARGTTLRLVLLHAQGSPEICVDPPEHVLAEAFARISAQ